MRRIRVYADTSVFGGTQDEEFKLASEHFFEQVKRGRYLILVSSVTLEEISRAPQKVREILEGLPEDGAVRFALDEEARELAEAYIAAGVLGPASRADATHVAAATVLRADLILSWNFRHIVNYERIRKFNAVNLLNGYRTVDIRSPREMEHGD